MLRHTYRACRADESHMIACYENSLKVQESDEVLGELFLSYVRTNNPKNMQLIAQRLFKLTGRRRFLFWSVCSMIQQPDLPPAMLMVAEKMLHRAMFDATISDNDIAHQVWIETSIGIISSMLYFTSSTESDTLYEQIVFTSWCLSKCYLYALVRKLWNL